MRMSSATHSRATGDWLETSDEALSVLSGLTGVACGSVTGCTAAGLSLVRGSGVETVAATDEFARAIDDAQYRTGDGPCLEAIRSREPVLVDDVTTDRRWPAISGEAKSAGLCSVLSLPVTADGHLFGALNMYAPGAAVFDTTSRDPGLAVARQGAVSLRYLQLLQAERAAAARQHDMAETLQRGLLPEVGDVDGVAAASRYRPSGEQVSVGGDWYDLLALPDDTVGLAIGDVAGHSIDAAVAMGQLRSVLRSYAWNATTSPACWTGSTTSSTVWAWRGAPPLSTPASSCPPRTVRGCSTPTPGTHHRWCTSPMAPCGCSPRDTRR